MRRAFLAPLLACAAGCGPEPRLWGSHSPDRALADDFALLDQHGAEFRLADQRGRVVVLFFGFVHCPDVCPTTLSTWARVQRELRDESDRVRFVFVTVDPERDTADRLARHLSVFGPDFVGLSGGLDELTPVYESFGAHRRVVPVSPEAGGYLVDHYAHMILIDRLGRVAAEHGFDAPFEHVLHDVRLLLREPR